MLQKKKPTKTFCIKIKKKYKDNHGGYFFNIVYELKGSYQE